MIAGASYEIVTLFAADISAAKAFYRRVFEPEELWEDEVSLVIRIGGGLFNLLALAEAPALVAPAPVAPPGAGAAAVFTLRVEDCDAACADLEARGASLLNGPVDRPWGRRTAAFADPSGHVWELAQEL